MAWLDTLGDVIANFWESRLIIRDSHEWIVLQGDPELCYREVALRSAMRVLQDGGQGYMVQFFYPKKGYIVQLWPNQGEETADQALPPEMQQVMETNEVIFQPLPDFPPHRSHDHAITL